MSRRAARALAVLAVVALAGLLGGCGGGEQAAEPDPTDSPEATTTAPATTTTVVPTTTVPAPATYAFPLEPAEAASYSQGHHDYPAVDIFAPIGTRVVAVTAGVVDFVSDEDVWDPAVNDPATRGGLSVAIIGDDGVRYYGSHLDSLEPDVEVGARVRTGQLLGHSGDSGNAAGTPPHLHFGISRPTTPDDWEVRRGQVDPFPYLVAWEAGEHRAPVLP